METFTAPVAAKPYLFPSLGPALMISMGYIDLGKWVAAVDGGVRFGYDLVLPVLFFNFTAILCQYLATCIGMVTGKNLAEMCSEEYSRSSCILLGVQAELSMITSDLTMILGIAHGLNLLFDIDLITCICFASVAAIFLPHFITTLDNQVAEALYVGIAGFALLCYVFGVLVSQPEIPLVMNVIFPKLSGESAYSLMALLGANIMAHNFYIHSAVVQQQRKPDTVAIGALFNDHLFAILFIFTGVFLVNYVLMNSAAAVSSSAEVLLSFQDVFLLMDQIFKTAIAPVVFFLVLLFASQINALTSNTGGKVIVQHLFGMNLSVSAHHLLVKVLAFILALYSAKVAGAEGIYQLLIFCQVMQAMVLPSSVIPLFRIASSRLIMGAFKISWYLEVLALFAFFGMLASNIIFIIEMLFGNSGWINNIKGSTGSNFVVPYTVLLLISCASIAFTLYLAATPLKSASEEPDNQLWISPTQKNYQELSESREVNNTPENIEFDDDQVSMVESNLDNLVESHPDKSTVEYQDLSETAVESDQDSKLSIDGTNTSTITCPSPTYLPEEPKFLLEETLPEIVNKTSPGNLPDSIKVETKVEAQAEVCTSKENDEAETLDSDKSLRETFPTSTTDGPGSLTSVKERGSDGFNGSESLSKISGLGRAARRQFAAILDEFWGNLFDFHGKLTQDASMKKLDVLLGLDLRVVGSSANSSAESSKNLFNDADKGLDIAANSSNFMSRRQGRISNLDLSYGRQIGSSSWAQNMQLPNTQLQNSSTNMLEGSEKLYSNFNLPAYSDTRDYQPATIHGYQLASYLKGSSVGRSPYSTISPDPQSASKLSSSFMTNYGDSVMYACGQDALGSDALGSLGTSGIQSPTAAQICRLQAENPYYNPSLVEPSESVGAGAYTKKYHTSPDISALIAASRSSLLNEGNWGGPIGPRPSLSRMASERSQYANSISRTGVPLPFNELSPPRLDRDVFSLQSNLNLNPDSKSLWSRQPFEQLFGVTKMDQSRGDGGIGGVAHRFSTAARQTSYAEAEAKLLQSLQFCITKLLKLEGSEWLFKQNGGCDEELIDRVASAERWLQGGTSEINQIYMGEPQHLASPDQKFGSVQRSEELEARFGQPLPNCGDNCVWRAALVTSFGVWCVRRILELSLVESRPELWGKYTYVLNRLQGILDQAFCKPRQSLLTCSCIELTGKDMRNLTKPLQNGQSLSTLGKPIRGSFTTASVVLEIIKDVEIAVSGRKGRTGTAAGDVAFPKGKENLASVLKRYKRRLSNKSSGAHEGTSSRKATSSGSLVL
ncbi:protein ETHYLENE-INSENSITIVE 2 isoform X3 [Ananas comosus]|uniref:Ethylene-insensitive protein 2 n=1 Tax=Ananas comosus TaxID=4615 RepID=A0A199V867_ANACO|nr:protein ETHYLENE-INSENSITIVE 2 isoform X3 [Ananas comosus]OAY73287.1 Ethylene-insensitive protein 2 [Ananas comosus]